MNGYTIDRALASCPATRDLYRGVLSADAPTACRLGVGFYVYNTDEAHQSGQHWVAQYRLPGVVRHFDSYGLRPFRTLARRMRAESCTPYEYEPTRLQGSGPTCGHFCLYYALHCADPYSHPMSVFSTWDLDWNDAEVVRLTRRVYGDLI